MSNDTKSDVGTALTSTPLHEQVKLRISRRIDDGEWPAGFVVPPEAELAQKLNVSQGTVRRAMQALTQEGLVMRRRRTGTVVTGRAPQHTLDRWYHYYRLHDLTGGLVNTDTDVLTVSRGPASDDIAERLNIPQDDTVIYLTRLRRYENRPVMIDRIQIPLRRIGNFPEKPEDVPPLLLKWLLEEHGLRLGAVREQVTACIASEDDRTLLEIEGNTPVALLEIDETAYDLTNEPLIIMRHSALTDAHCYVNEVR